MVSPKKQSKPSQTEIQKKGMQQKTIYIASGILLMSLSFILWGKYGLIQRWSLEQEKLDVLIKKRSNLFNWRGQFTPEFVEYILTSFAKEGDHIFDPFSGSGTVLQESARLGFKATGFEINPSAYAMSKFFCFCNLSNEERVKFCNSFETKLNTQLKEEKA